MIHYCPRCGAFSWHGPGARHWALRCPACSRVAKQSTSPPADDVPTRHSDELASGGIVSTPTSSALAEVLESFDPTEDEELDES